MQGSKLKRGSLKPITKKYTLTSNPPVKKSDNIVATSINRTTLTDITNNKTVTTLVKGIPIKQDTLCKENSTFTTPEKEDVFEINKERGSNLPESLSRRETYFVNKGNARLPVSSSPVLTDSGSHEGTFIACGERYSVDNSR